jgi:hypothetical protein
MTAHIAGERSAKLIRRIVLTTGLKELFKAALTAKMGDSKHTLWRYDSTINRLPNVFAKSFTLNEVIDIVEVPSLNTILKLRIRSELLCSHTSWDNAR